MTDDEALEVFLLASHVIHRSQYQLSPSTAEIDALRQLAETAEERSQPAEELARTVMVRLFMRRESQRGTPQAHDGCAIPPALPAAELEGLPELAQTE